MNQLCMTFVETRSRRTDSLGRIKRQSQFTSGMKIGLFTLLAPSVNKHGRECWLAICECGVEKMVFAYSLKSGHTKSCGCYQKKIRASLPLKHGHSAGKKSPTYSSWQAMLHRCTNKDSKHFPHYGGRGILVCDEWKSFAGFLADMGEKPPGTSIDRIDGSKGYFPGNCRWATPGVQASNTTRAKLTPVTAVKLYELKGSMTGTEAAKIFGVSAHTVYSVWRGVAWKDFTRQGVTV